MRRRSWTVLACGQSSGTSTVPSLRPTTFYVMVNMIIGSFNVFIQVMMLTGGNPSGKTSTLQYLLYDTMPSINLNSARPPPSA